MRAGQTFQQATQVQTLRLCPNQGWPRHRPDKLANTQQNPAFAQLSIDRCTQAGLSATRWKTDVLQCGAECLLLAQSGHANRSPQCLLLGVKRTSRERSAMSAFDPSRKSGGQVCCAATKSLLVSWSHPLRCLVLSRGRRNEAALKSGRQSSDPPQASTALKEKRSDYHSGRGCSMNSESCALPASVCQDNEGVAERYE